GVAAGLGLVFLVLVRSLAGLGYAEQAINAAYLNEMFAHSHSDPVMARRRGLIYSLVQSGCRSAQFWLPGLSTCCSPSADGRSASPWPPSQPSSSSSPDAGSRRAPSSATVTKLTR
ncbi:transporter protein, partial [Arthrobacter sp. Hiyo6]